jgi:hypothetical protein
MSIEWMEYPISLGSDVDDMTITWSDGTTDIVPAHDGDGETFYQLPDLMEEIFRVENFACFEGQSDQFSSEYPTLYRSPTGVLVLRVNAEGSFLNAFVCKSKDAAECILSWINGDIVHFLQEKTYPPEGSTDFHWISVKEVLALIGSGLIDEFPPIIFEPEKRLPDVEMPPGSFVPTPVVLPWYYPPLRDGPSFAYPACLFQLDSYVESATLAQISETSVAVSVNQTLSDNEWNRLLEGCRQGSIAERILSDSDGFGERFTRLSKLAKELGPIYLDRWENFF